MKWKQTKWKGPSKFIEKSDEKGKTNKSAAEYRWQRRNFDRQVKCELKDVEIQTEKETKDGETQTKKDDIKDIEVQIDFVEEYEPRKIIVLEE